MAASASAATLKFKTVRTKLKFKARVMMKKKSHQLTRALTLKISATHAQLFKQKIGPKTPGKTYSSLTKKKTRKV